MIPVHCRVRHDPDAGTYGDCVRACVASILELDAEKVPHFYHDNCDTEIARRRIDEFLDGRGLCSFITGYDDVGGLGHVLQHMEIMNPDCYYMLFGQTAETGHVVVCKGGKVVHNPAWFPAPLVKPTESGYWVVMVLARK